MVDANIGLLFTTQCGTGSMAFPLLARSNSPELIGRLNSFRELEVSRFVSNPGHPAVLCTFAVSKKMTWLCSRAGARQSLVILDADSYPKTRDFGMDRITNVAATQGIGTPLYLVPEIIYSEDISSRAMCIRSQ
jgi:hypothetical protein